MLAQPHLCDPIRRSVRVCSFHRCRLTAADAAAEPEPQKLAVPEGIKPLPENANGTEANEPASYLSADHGSRTTGVNACHRHRTWTGFPRLSAFDCLRRSAPARPDEHADVQCELSGGLPPREIEVGRHLAASDPEERLRWDGPARAERAGC